jgi:hypothetical protein
MRLLPVCCALAVLSANPASAQLRPVSEGAITTSLGQPVSWKGTVAAGPLWQAGTTVGGATALGVQRDLVNPIAGLFTAHGELYFTRAGGQFDGGARARLTSPFLRFGIGADYSLDWNRVDLMLSTQHPLRRGGVFKDGSILRADYIPARKSFSVQIEKPIRRRVQMGGSRPPHDYAALPSPHGSQWSSRAVSLPATASTPLDVVADAAKHVRRSVLPRAPYADDQRAGFDAQLDRYHDALDVAFSIATSTRSTSHSV